MSFIEERKVLTREKRVGALSHFNGTLETLKGETERTEMKQRIRTMTQVSNDEIILALRTLSKIEGAAVIVHGAIGCSASGLFFEREKPFFWYSTNLNERDTILGGDEKLRKAVLRAYDETGARVIFIVGTPVVAINNDDVNSLILEMEEDLEIKIIWIYTDGFKSKAAVTGYDIISHSLLRYLVDRQIGNLEKKEPVVNLLSFSEKKEDLRSVLAILKDLGISYQVLPQYSDVNTIKKAGAASATIALNPDEGGYFAEELEEVFHVPYIRTEVPVGLRKTKKFILKIARELGIEEKAEDYIKEEETKADFAAKRAPLAGKTVFLDTELSYASGFVELIENLGGTVEGISIPYVDLENRKVLKKLSSLKSAAPVIIANGQPFEKANVISKKKPDYDIGEEAAAFASEFGTVPVSLANRTVLGYEGVRQLVTLIERAGIYPAGKNGIYKKSWLAKSGNWYVKQEVK